MLVRKVLKARDELCVVGDERLVGEEAHPRAHDAELEAYLHLALSNRGVLITPFHNMVLMCPETSEADVDLHADLFDEAVGALVR